jgi:YHS domain-containing protein
MKKTVYLLSLLLAVSLITYAGFNLNVASASGCKTKQGCATKTSCQTKCMDNCCCKKSDGKCCADGVCDNCECCKTNGCCKMADGKCNMMKDGKCHMKCDADCCCKKSDGKCCADGVCDNCECCKKNGCCKMADGKCNTMKPCATKAAESSPDASVDPICGMDVAMEGAKFTSELDGTTYYFCCEYCKNKFDEDPSKYLGDKAE